MTPEAVLYRYLQMIAAPQPDMASVQALLCADADLLGRWLSVLRIPADYALLTSRLSQLDIAQTRSIGESQGWAELPAAPTTRLSLAQWQAALEAALLAQRIAEYLGDRPETARFINEDVRNYQMRAILAVSGIHLPADRRLAQINEFRGTNPALLEDATLELRIFAVADGLTAGRSAELAQQLLGMDEAVLRELIGDARRAAEQALDALVIEQGEDIDWPYRIWLRQQMQSAAPLFEECTSWHQLAAVHEQISASIFHRAPLVLYQPQGQNVLRLLDDATVEIGLHSATSGIASAARAGAPSRVLERPDAAVIDRQLLGRLGTEEALAMPVPGGEQIVVLLAAQEEDRDMAVAAEIYAEELARYIDQISGVADESGADDQVEQFEMFREHEHQRLREIVHEANNPLSIVHNSLHMLQMRLQHEPEAVQQLELIGTELRRAADIFSRARDIPQEADETADPGIGEREELEAVGWLTDVAQLHRGMARNAGVELNLDLPAHTVMIDTYPDALAQIVSNLLKNAIEACASGDSITAGIRGEVYRSRQFGIDVFVRDTGPGLPSDVYEHLTEPKTSHKGGDHQGIGLQVAFRLADEMGGFIDVSSTRGLGTEFTIFLPRTPRVERE